MLFLQFRALAAVITIMNRSLNYINNFLSICRLPNFFCVQIQQNKQLLDTNVEETGSTVSHDSFEQYRPVSSVC